MPRLGRSAIVGPDRTVNIACAVSYVPPTVPITVTVYDPLATFATVKVPLTVPVPDTIVQAALVTLDPVIEHVVSDAMNPLPVTVTLVPRVPLRGLRCITGPVVTLKVASAKSLPPELPVTRTMYDPADTLPTVKLPVG